MKIKNNICQFQLMIIDSLYYLFTRTSSLQNRVKMRKLNNIIKKAFSMKNHSQKQEKLLIASKICHHVEIQNIKLVMVLWRNQRTDEKFETLERQSFFLQHPQIFYNSQQRSFLQSDSIKDNLATFKIFAIFLGNYYLVTFKSPPNKMITFKNLIIRKLPALLEMMNLDEQVHTQFYQGHEPSKMYRLDFLIKKVKQAERAVLPFVNGEDKARYLVQMSKCNLIKLEEEEQPVIPNNQSVLYSSISDKAFLKGLGLGENTLKKLCQMLNQNQQYNSVTAQISQGKNQFQPKSDDSCLIEENEEKEQQKSSIIQMTNSQLNKSKQIFTLPAQQFHERNSDKIRDNIEQEIQPGEIIDEQDEDRKLIAQ